MKTLFIRFKILFILVFLFQYGYSQETRETAQLLTSSVDFTVNNTPDTLWYRYVADSSCTVTFTTDFQSGYYIPFELYLYKDTCEIPYWNNLGVNASVESNNIRLSNRSEVSTILEQGEELYIEAYKFFGTSQLSVSFNIRANEEGTSFQNPIPVLLDSTPMVISTQNNPYSFVYYELNPRADLYVNLESEESFWKVYQRLSDGTLCTVDRIREKTIYSGDTYIFEFPTIFLSDFSWYLVADTVDLGHDCISPIRISTEDTSDFFIDSEWIKIFAEKEGYYTISLHPSENNDHMLIFSHGCNNNSNSDTIISGEYTIFLEAGEDRNFELYGADSGVEYNLSLTYIEEMQGGSCDTPIEVFLDSNYTQINPETYFMFTPSESGDFIITLEQLTSNFGSIITMTDCNFSSLEYYFITAFNTDYSQTRVSFEGDTTYLIRSGFSSLISNCTFSIRDYTPIHGETCSDAIEVTETGSYIVDHPTSDIWLRYIAEYSGTMYASTLDSTSNTTYLKVFRGDCDNQISESEYYMNTGQSFTDFDVLEGDTIYIQSELVSWGYYDAYPITIGYTNLYRDGYSCEHPLLITDFQNPYTTSYSSDTLESYYKIILNDEAEITITDESASNFIQLFSDCETRIASSETGNLTIMLETGEYVFEWINTSGEDINWTISFNDNPDTDNDGTPNATDDDDDNDGVPDSEDQFPYDATESLDTDNDGLGNNIDTDDDGDGLLDFYDPYPLQPVSIDELYNECAGILVQPNPVNDRLEITGLESGLVYSIKIIDSKGTIVLIQNEYIEGTTIDVSGLEASIYTVLIQNEARTFSTTFFKK